MVDDLVKNLMEVIMMIRSIRMRLEVVVKARGETIPIISMIRTIEIREEEVEEKDLDEEASMGKIFIVENMGIEDLNIPSAKEEKFK